MIVLNIPLATTNSWTILTIKILSFYIAANNK